MKLGYKAKLDGQDFEGLFDEQTQAQLLPGISLSLVTATDSSTGVSRRRLEVHNQTNTPVAVQQAHIRYLLPTPFTHLEYFTSDWGSEYSPVGLDVTYPVTIGTWHGRSSKGCATYFTAGWKNIFGAETCVLGISVGWSGNWQADIRRLENANSVTVGLALNNPSSEGLEGDPFYTMVAPGETFENIDIFDCYRPDYDTEALSFSFRSYYKNNIRLLAQGSAPVPVCYNHWWPYEDKWINEDVFLANAKLAAQIGCTNTMLDAGWFGPSEIPDPAIGMPWFLKRGDWDMVNKALFPAGIAELSRHVKVEAGLPFGIWCEIEAVGSEANLKKLRPELIARRSGRVLDYVCMGNPATVAWALEIFERLIEEYGARWIKIDFNLDPVSCDCEEHGHGKGDGLYAHYRGLYTFMDEVRRRWPYVVLENCSSGGLRIDYGIMQHCHYCFLSDPDFTRHHLQCFWGVTSHIHPSACYHFTQSEIVGEHNVRFDAEGQAHIVLQPITENTSMIELDYMTRAAMTGVLGFSLKLVDMPPKALARLAEHVAFYKSYSREYLLEGDMYRLAGPTRSIPGQGNEWSAFQLCSSGNKHIVFVFNSEGRQAQQTIRLKGLVPGCEYAITSQNTGETTRANGEELMQAGLLCTSAEPLWSEVYSISPSQS